MDNSDKYSFSGVYNIDTVVGHCPRDRNTFQPLTMIFANHLLVPSKTIDFVDSMNVLCSLHLNSNVSLDIHLVYRSDTFRSNQQIHLKDCYFKLSQNYTELSCTCGLIDDRIIVVKIGRAEIKLPKIPFSFFRILIIMRPFWR